MALQHRSGEIPSGAAILTENEALKYQWQVISDWSPKSEVWPFTFGIGILGGLGALAGIFVNNHYRYKLKLGKYGKLATYVPIVFLPTAMTAVFHQQVITNDILIQKTPCPLCLELRAAAIQTFFGCIYPSVLAPLGNFMFAARHGTYNVPFITQDYMSVIRLWKKFTLPVGNILFAIFVSQALAGMWVTYHEAKSLATIQSKLLLLEKYYDEKSSSGM